MWIGNPSESSRLVWRRRAGVVSASSTPAERGSTMPRSSEHASDEQLPDWAIDQASVELPDVEDQAAIAQRGGEIVRDDVARNDERHDDYDDPDQGGEA